MGLGVAVGAGVGVGVAVLSAAGVAVGAAVLFGAGVLVGTDVLFGGGVLVEAGVLLGVVTTSLYCKAARASSIAFAMASTLLCSAMFLPRTTAPTAASTEVMYRR